MRIGYGEIMAENGKYLSISIQTFKRLPYYYDYLKSLKNEGTHTVSAPAIAKRMQLNEVQVRKDLAAVSHSGGKPRRGFEVEELIYCIEGYLGYDNVNEAVLVGVGQLGHALMHFKGFSDIGVSIVGAFDNDPAIVGSELYSTKIMHTDKLADFCRRLGIRIGIVTVPSDFAQHVSDLLVSGGVRAIWNFAPIRLSVSDDVIVQNENLAASLSLLTRQLEKMTDSSGS